VYLDRCGTIGIIDDLASDIYEMSPSTEDVRSNEDTILDRHLFLQHIILFYSNIVTNHSS
jgi:hypothetical protein